MPSQWNVALGNAFYNDLVNEHEIYGIKRTFSQSFIEPNETGKFNCPGKGYKFGTSHLKHLASHCKSHACIQLKKKSKKRYEKDQKLDQGGKLWTYLMEKLEKATARKTFNKKQSTYILLGVPIGVELSQISFLAFRKLIFYVGVCGIIEIRLQKHASKIRRDMERYISLDPKSERVRAIWKDEREVIAVFIGDLHANQALGLEYAIMSGMRRELTNVDDSGQ